MWQSGGRILAQSPAGWRGLRARLDTKDDDAQLAYVESQRSLDRPVDTSLAFLEAER